MARSTSLLVVILLLTGCPGPAGETGAPGQPRKVFDGNGAELGVLIGTSLAWGYNSATSTVFPSGQMITFEDADGVFWNVGAGGGGFQIPNVPVFFASGDCSGPVLLRNASPFVPLAFTSGSAPLKGVYQATDTADVTPQSYLNAGDPTCIAAAPAPNPAPNVTIYRNAVRLDDYPRTPLTPPITLGP